MSYPATISLKRSLNLITGNDELMKGVGKDATKLFEEVHAWVNYEQLLAKCYVGPLVNSATVTIKSDKNASNVKGLNNGIFKTPILPFRQTNSKLINVPSENSETIPIECIPRFDWIQKTSDLTIIFYTKSLCNPGFSVIYASDTEVEVQIVIERTMHICKLKFSNAVDWPCLTRVANETG